jgi:peptidoglycan hydrolase CwlO-like protein
MKHVSKKMMIVAIAAMLVCSSLLVIASAQPTNEPVGKEIASTFKELAKSHQSDIEDFILEKKVDMAQTNEERLDIIDNYVENLRTTIEEVNAARQDLIAKFEAGEISVEEFRVEMKALSQDIAATAKTMGGLGEKLGTLGQDLGEANRARAQQIVSGLQEFAQEMAQAGQTIGNQLSEKGLNLPEIPQIPNLPPQANKP